ncbi:MAG: family 16 glycoside hydrolase, partial [Planctomycetota bacterium]
MFTRPSLLTLAFVLGCTGFACTAVGADKVLLKDDFNRSEKDDSKEQPGGKWKTNSKSRAGGNKQVDLKDGVLHIYRHKTADHGVSVVHDLPFSNVDVQMRFKLRRGDDLGINLADMKEKSVHAGHICVARVQTNRVTISDLKTGRMRLEVRTARKSGKETPEMKRLIKSKENAVKHALTPDQWHQLHVKIDGNTMSVKIDGKLVNQFASPGI